MQNGIVILTYIGFPDSGISHGEIAPCTFAQATGLCNEFGNGCGDGPENSVLTTYGKPHPAPSLAKRHWTWATELIAMPFVAIIQQTSLAKAC